MAHRHARQPWGRAGALALTFSLMAAAVHAQTPTPATTESAVQSDDAMHVNTDATFVRDAPNVRGKVLLRLERGEQVEVLERLDGDWWQVRVGDPPQSGYVHRRVLAPGAGTLPRRERVMPAIEPAGEQPETEAENDAARPGRPGIGAVAFGGVGVFSPMARDSFDAVGITGNPLVVGGGVEVTRVWRSLFIRGAFDYSKETGERAFVTSTGERFPMGIPLDIRLVPIDVSVGWRFDARRPGREPRRLVPYVAGGVGVLLYRETDEFAEGDEVVDERFTSYHVLGGVDVYLQRRLAVRAEFRYRAVPDALGEGGVSAIKGDSSLGGAVFFVGLSLGR